MEDNLFEQEEFKKMFWEWWDEQSPSFRKQYTYHSHGKALSEFYFYNKKWVVTMMAMDQSAKLF